MNCLFHLKKKLRCENWILQVFVLFVVNGVSLQVHQEHTWYVSVLLINNILLVEALNLEVTYKDLVNEVVCDQSNCECIIHCCSNCPGTNTFGKFLEEELSDIDPDIQLHYSQW